MRSLLVLPGLGFASGSNDNTIKLWTNEGELISELVGHTQPIYGMDRLENGDIISCGDDGVRIWSGTECIDHIVHPQGVWSVIALENGDIAT